MTIPINYKTRDSRTRDVIWRPSDSSYQTNIFNQLEIIDPSEAGQKILHSTLVNTTIDMAVDNSKINSSQKIKTLTAVPKASDVIFN